MLWVAITSKDENLGPFHSVIDTGHSQIRYRYFKDEQQGEGLTLTLRMSQVYIGINNCHWDSSVRLRAP